LLIALLLVPPDLAFAASPDATACTAASASVERSSSLPPRLLDAIGLVETGRPDPVHHVIAPWPWSVDVDGVGYFYASKQEAIAATVGFQAAGSKSIDVGCMQINLLNHPTAFVSLDQAFDPMANTAYAAQFLQALYRQTGNWPAAAAAYHSQTPGIGEPYRDRVMALWPLAGQYGATVMTSANNVDPYHVLTETFRAQLEQDAAFRAKRNAAMLIAPISGRLAKSRRTASLRRGWRDAAR
jgi:hypothetical protein